MSLSIWKIYSCNFKICLKCNSLFILFFFSIIFLEFNRCLYLTILLFLPACLTVCLLACLLHACLVTAPQSIPQTFLGLTVYHRVAPNSLWSSCLSLPNAGVIDVKSSRLVLYYHLKTTSSVAILEIIRNIFTHPWVWNISTQYQWSTQNIQQTQLHFLASTFCLIIRRFHPSKHKCKISAACNCLLNQTDIFVTHMSQTCCPAHLHGVALVACVVSCSSMSSAMSRRVGLSAKD